MLRKSYIKSLLDLFQKPSQLMRKQNAKRVLFLTIICIISLSKVNAQEAVRPPVWGIAKMTFLVSDFQVAKDYYGNFLVLLVLFGLIVNGL